MKFWSYEAFVFDLDGTLIDSETFHAQAFSDAVEHLSGYRLSQQERHEFFASHSMLFAAELNKRHGLSLVPEDVLSYKQKRVQETFDAALFPEALDFLELWHGKKPLALATNSPLEFVQLALEKLEIAKFFDCVTTSNEVLHRKPDPEIIEKTIRKMGVDPFKTLVFEDQLIGIEAARSAGAQAIAIDNGQPVDYPADVAVYRWSELIKLSEKS